MYAFRFLFMLVIFMPLAAALCVRIFRGFKINYIFTLELDPHYRVTHIQLIRVRINHIDNSD